MIHFFNSHSSIRLFEAEGRVGTKIGSTNMTTFSSYQEAQMEFNAIFKEKTGNEFGVNEFVKMAGKFNLVDIDNELLERPLHRNTVRTTLSKPLYKLMESLFDDNVMKSTLIAFCLDLDSLPLGVISRQQMLDSLNLLEVISSMLGQENARDQLIAASNEFHS